MNRDSDIPEDILLRLLLEPLSADDSRSGTRYFPTVSGEPTSGEPTEQEGLDNLPTPPIYPGFETSTLVPAALADDALDPNYTPVFDSGDLFTVQPHFEALLKRRLRHEISHRPPSLTPGTSSVWLDHLKNLSVPAGMPEELLADLLNECQRVAQDIQQTGRRLVAAVEALFPDQPQTLEYIAGLVARPAYRSTQAQTLAQVDYATASTQQQVALAMLSAQEIFEALSLTVSADAPTQEQVWLTTAGPMTVQAIYQAASNQLEVRVRLPAGGSLVMTSLEESLGSERSTPGELVLRLSTQPGAMHRLDVS